MALHMTLNGRIWEDINKLDSKKQRELLEWQLQEREPICKFSDIKLGDHLIQKRSVGGKVLYYHHFLCIGFDDEGRPTIIHYYGTVGDALNQLVPTGFFRSGSNFGQAGIVSELTLPHKDLIQSESELQEKGAEVERVVWPEELKRYPVEEVIKRARKRKDEKYYHLTENNCESYVMWCLCDLNISLQSTSLVLSLTEIASGVKRSAIQLFEQVPKVFTEVIERILGRTAFGNMLGRKGVEGLSGLGSIFGVASTVLAEIINAAFDIYHAKQKWNEGTLIKSRKEFIQEVTNIVFLALSRSGFTIGGMIMGQCLIPVPFVGSFIGMLAGMLVGHIAGKFMSISSPLVARGAEKLIDSEDLKMD